MSTTPSPDTQLVLQLQRIDELFNAPEVSSLTISTIDALPPLLIVPSE